MIINAEIINISISGEYEEVIFDSSSTWRSSTWGWIKFTNYDYTEWVGEFRGKIIGVEISQRFNSVLVLTTDCLYLLDRISNKIVDTYENPEYNQLTVSPSQEYIVANSCEIFIIKDSLTESFNVDLYEDVFGISFIKWEGNDLIIECENYDGDFFNISLNSKTYKVQF